MPILARRTVALGALALVAPSAAAQCLPATTTGPLPVPFAQSGDELGAAVALDATGQRALVGAPGDATLGRQAGAAWVFRRDGGGWVLEAELLGAAGAAGQRFGSAVALSAGGDRALVGAPDDGPAGVGVGAVHSFERTGTAWVEQDVLPGGPDDRRYGASVALSAGADVALVGAPEALVPQLGGFSGVVHAYGQRGANWVEEAVLIDLIPFGGFNGDQFGASVALTPDGARALVGVPHHGQFGPYWQGGMASYERVGTTWSLEATADGVVVACEMTDFGRAVALSSDGTRALVGTPTPIALVAQPTCPASGSVRELVLNEPKWDLVSVFAPTGGDDDDRFGSAVAWDFDAGLALVGAPGDDDAGPDAGAAYLFERTGTDWVQVDKVTLAGTGGGGAAGAAVALSDGALTALVGAPTANAAANASGAAEVFEAGFPRTYCTAKTASPGCVPRIDSAGSPSLTSGAPFLVTARDIVNRKNGLFFYGVNGRASLPFLGGTLCVLPPLQRTPIQGSGGSAPPLADCSGSFVFDLNAWAQSGQDPDLQPGVGVNGQYWYRDPAHPDGTGVGLSDAVELGFCD